MKVGQIFTKIGSFIGNRQIFMLLNCNCAEHPNFEDFKHAWGRFFRGLSVETVSIARLPCIRNFKFKFKFRI